MHAKRNVQIFKKHLGKTNSLQGWYKVRNPLKIVLNFIIMHICKHTPSLSIKNFLYRRTGMKIGRNVSIGLGAMFDIFFPELIEIGDNCIIGYKSTILTHEFLMDEFRKGSVKINNDVMIGAWVLILPGVKVGNRARIAAFSLVNNDVEPEGFAGGIPIRKIK